MIYDVRINIIFLIFSHCGRLLRHIVVGLAVTLLLLEVQNDWNTEKYKERYDRYSIIKCGSYAEKQGQDKLQNLRQGYAQNNAENRPFLEYP